MKRGTKSLLFGVHQIFWHPLLVSKAWITMYGYPSWKELICIVIHDWGYWGKSEMDSESGERHVEFGAKLAGALFGQEYFDLCLLHSRHYARRLGREPSKLCWADKLHIIYDSAWFYLLRARLSGELSEYRVTAANSGFVPMTATDMEWFKWIRQKFIELAEKQKADAVPYTNPYDLE